MESEIAVDCPPFIRIYKNGKIERLTGTPIVPASLDPQNGVVSKDVPYSPENNLSVRLYIPHKTLDTAAKLPLLVYIHGGGFLIESAFSTLYHDFLIAVASAADCVVVSVDYRLAPENPIPAAYDDSWAALEWVFAHFSGSGPEEWLNKHADFRRGFLAGDSAGANISHHMGMKAGEKRLVPEGNGNGGYAITGIILVHPYFWAKEPIDKFEVSDGAARELYEKVWDIASPNSKSGCDDPRLNVVGYGPSLAGLGCERVMVMVAEKDPVVRQGLAYAAKLKKSEWNGEVDVVETKGENHVFHLFNPGSENAELLRKKFTDFIKGDK